MDTYCACGGHMVPEASSHYLKCVDCGCYYPYPEERPVAERSVWYRTRTASYTRTMKVADLLPDGTVRGETQAWWEPWP